MDSSQRPILLAVDGMSPPEWMMPEAISLAERLGCGVRLVHPVDPIAGPDAARAGELRFFERVVARARKRGGVAAVQVVPGDPVGVVLDAARTLDARLIALVGQRRGGPARWLFHHIAEEVVARASMPVLLQTGAAADGLDPFARPPGPVIVPLDGSAWAERAVDVAVPLARALGETLCLVRAIGLPAAGPHARVLPAGYLAAADLAAEYVQEVARAVGEEGVWAMPITGHLPAGHLIRDVAGAQGASLVVMTSATESGGPFHHLGTVVEEVASRASIPVLLVGPRADVESRRARRDPLLAAA